jgi:sugar phosphate isomerase/epimerase
MHLGIFAKTFPRPTLETTLDAIAEHGITHVQFNMSCASLLTLPERLDENFCVWIARSFRERGLTMAAISGTFNLCDPNAVAMMENLRRLEILCAACRWLDTRIITLCTGTRDTEDMWKWHPANVRRETWSFLVGVVQQAVRVADRHEVTLAFEPEQNNVVNSVAKARMLLDEIESPWLKVVFDPANLMRADDRPRLAQILDEAFDWLGEDIVLAHAKNPAYAQLGDDLSAIREWLGRDEAKAAAVKAALTRIKSGEISSLSEMLELTKDLPFLPYLESPNPTLEFFRDYIDELKRRDYQGSLIIHGMDEDQVPYIETMLAVLIGSSRRKG